MACDDERLQAGEPVVTLSRWQLSAVQWEMLTALLRLDGYPAPIQVRSAGRTDVEAAHLRAEANTELSRRGLIRAGRVEPDLEAALWLLHSPACWVASMWLPDSTTDEAVRVIAARKGAVGVCALQHPEQPGATLLEIIPADGLALAVVGKLPPHPPGRSPAVTLPRQPRAEPGRGVLVASSPTRTSTERAGSAAIAILDQPHLRAGQIVATVRDPSGRVRRSEVLRWCDNPDGRYQVTLSRPPGGPEWLAVNPADSQRLGDGVQRLLASLRPMIA
ncbi:MAG: ESX secretion-associated protein EspG [Pseudonocardiaceae bacterium]